MNSRRIPIFIVLFLLGLGAFLFLHQDKNKLGSLPESVSSGKTAERRQISVFINNRSRNIALGEKLALLLHEHGYITSLAATQVATSDSALKTSEIVSDEVNLPQAKMLQSDLGAGMIVRSTTGGFLSSVTLNAGDDINLEKLPLLQNSAK